MANLDCPIWGTPATETRDSNGDNVHVFSHRAGGTYTTAGSAVQELKGLSSKDKTLLTTWLCEQRSLGVTDPLITTYTIKEIKTRHPLSVSQRISSALLFFNGIRLGDTVTVFDDSDFTNADHIGGFLAASTECEDKSELLALLALMGEMALLADKTRTMGQYEYSPTARGWMRIEDLMLNAPDKAQAFVAMWFDPVTDNAYNDGIAKAISTRGYRPLRIDNKEHANKIDDEIIAEIRRSRFVVADFTCETGNVRGGVYYEAGFAAGLSIRVIWTCHKDSIDSLHFDTRQYNHIVWEAPDDLRVKLEARIGAVMGDGPLPKSPKDAC